MSDLYAPARASVTGFAQAIRTSGNVSTNSVNLVNFDTGTDLTVTAQAGDLVELNLNCQAGDNLASPLDWNVATIVSGAEVSRVGGAGVAGSIPAWSLRGGDYFAVSATVPYRVVAADVVNGTVKFRLLFMATAGIARPVFANAAAPFTWWAKNLRTVNT